MLNNNRKPTSMMLCSGILQKKRRRLSGYVERCFLLEGDGRLLQKSGGKKKVVATVRPNQALLTSNPAEQIIQIQTKSGDKIQLKAKSEEDFTTWIRNFNNLLRLSDEKSDIMNEKSETVVDDKDIESEDELLDEDDDFLDGEESPKIIKPGSPTRNENAQRSAFDLRNEMKESISHAAERGDLSNSPADPVLRRKSLEQHLWVSPSSTMASTLSTARSDLCIYICNAIRDAFSAIKEDIVDLILDEASREALYSCLGKVSGGRYVAGVQKEIQIMIKQEIGEKIHCNILHLENVEECSSSSSDGTIYLISPSEKNRSIETLLGHFEGKRSEGRVLILFSETASASTMKRLSTCRNLRRRLCREPVILSGIFSCRASPRSVSLLASDFVHCCYAPGSKEHEFAMNRLVKRFVSVCAALGEFPHVRFISSSPLSTKFAFNLEKSLKTYIGSHPTFQFKPNRASNIHCMTHLYEATLKRTLKIFRARTQVLVLDRLHDLTTPLMRDVRLEPLTASWIQVCEDFQVHPAPCAVDRVSEEWFESFATLSLGEVAKRMQSLVMSPTHNLLESKVQLTELCKSLGKMFGKPKELEEMAAMELEHAYGVNFLNRKKPKRMTEKSRDEHLTSCLEIASKLPRSTFAIRRLLAIALLSSSERFDDEKLLRRGLSNDYINHLRHLRYLHMNRPGHVKANDFRVETDEALKFIKAGLTRRKSIKKVLKKRRSFKDKLFRKKIRVEDAEDQNLGSIHSRDAQNIISLKRRGSLLCRVLLGHLEDTLSKDTFPWVVPPAAPAPMMDDDEKSKSHLIVFVIGGVTHGELTCIRDLEKERGDVNITVVSSSIDTPDQFISNMQKIRMH